VHTIRMLAVVLVLSGISTLGHGQSSATGAPVPNLVNFAGTLKDLGGHPIQSVTGVTFALYAEEEGGVPLWLETQTVQADGKGNYTVQLGATKAEGLPLELFTSSTARWLGVRMNGGEEQPRVLLVSVPYALKAADSQTLGGLPASAFMLAAPANAVASSNGPASTAAAAVPPPAGVTGSGTASYLPLWTGATALGDSAIFQTGSGSTARIGIDTSTPSSTLDVKGAATFRGAINMAATGIATASAGKVSQASNFAASAFNSATKTAVNETFHWRAEPVGNNTSNPGASMNLLFAQGTATPTETGFAIASNGQVSFASGQTFPGTGTITGVTAGTGLAGGGTTGTVALSVDSSQVPFLNIANTFSGTQTASSATGIGFLGESNSSYGVYGSSSSGYGVVGVSNTGTGTYGGSTNSHGVYGSSSNSDGVLGVSGTGTGVTGESSSGYGVYGTSPGNYGVIGVTSSGNGVYGQVSVAPQGGVIGRQLDASGNWAVYAFGNIGATGTKSSVVSVDNGTRQVALYAVESPGVWFEDYGSGKLVSGVATVNIDPAYAQTVNTGVEYHVFLTPDGDCDGLYVATRTATGFEVRELHQGKSTVAFDYRIIALRRGYETKRLADVTNATPRSAIETPAGHVGSAGGTATAK
jgi:hypothetical protein